MKKVKLNTPRFFIFTQLVFTHQGDPTYNGNDLDYYATQEKLKGSKPKKKKIKKETTLIQN